MVGMISLDSIRGRELGFTSDRFDGYLWESAERITISFIVSKERGNFRQLVATILALGKEVAVPTPFPNMERILRKNGYTQTFEHDGDFGPVEVWILKPEAASSAAA